MRFQLPQQPQAVLRQRLGQCLGARQRGDRCGACGAIGDDLCHSLAVVGQYRRLEQGTQAHVDTQLIGQARCGLSGGDGVTAQQQEVVVRGHRLYLEDVAPHSGDACLQVIASGCTGTGFAHLRETGIAVQAAIVHAQAAGRALQLAAGGLRQRAGVQQQDHGRGLSAGVGNDLAQGLDQVLGLECLLHVAADLHRDTDALLALVLDGEHCHTAFAQHLDFTLEGFFQVLRVQVLSAHDQHVFQAPGNEHLALTHETQVAGTQPGLAVHFDEGSSAGFWVAPVAPGDARAACPDFPHLVVAQHLQLLRLDDAYRVPRLREAATHQHAASAGFGAVGGEGFGIQLKRGDTLATTAAANEQGGFGQTITGEEALRVEATGLELVGKGGQAVLADRLGTGIGHAPAAQVEPGQRSLADPLAAQAISEVGATANGATVFADGLQPAQRPGQEVPRRHQHARHATEDRLQQAADQAHVMVQR
ncbi:hypothetical protein D3C81_519440 [compost metagenome]